MGFLFSNYYQVTLFIGGVIALISSLTVYYDGPKKAENIGWFLSNFFAAIWSFGYLLMISTKNYEQAYLSNIVLHWAAIFIPLFYFFFALAITNTYEKYKNVFYLYSVMGIVLEILNPSRNFVTDVFPKYIFNFAPNAGYLYKYFTIYFFAVVISALLIIYRSLKDPSNSEKIDKLRIKYIFIASVFGFAGGSSVFLLTFNIPIPPYSLALFSLYPIVITFAILKHHLFNVRVIATELFIFSLWMFIIIKILFSQDITERISNIILLAITIAVGILLIKSVWKEVRNREKLEKMSIQLAVANDELKRVDAAKSEFLSIVSHQLRTPLTAIKGYISMMIEGTYGKLEEIQNGTLEKVFQSAERLIVLVNDLLNLNRIEDGRIIYTFAPVDIAQMIDDAIFDLKSMAENKGLKLAWIKPHGLPMAWADADKIRQVVINFIDNSIKYTASGNVNVSLRLENDYLVYAVKDTGVGMTPEGKNRLFRKFERGEGGRLMYTEGTGLGLYVAKLMTEAHKGTVSGESEGKDKGSTFSIRIPTEEYAKKNNVNQQPIEPIKPA
ncbi:MAG: ATP-binding protein [Patescibacteria group bacterium]